MATSVTINGVSYRVADDYEIRQQGGAVSATRLRVLLETHPIPLLLQQAQVRLDTTLFFTGLIQKVGTPEYSSTYETNVFSLDVSSLECLFNNLLVTKNFYSYSYTSWTEVIQYLFTNYISAENITLGEISTISVTFDSKYSVKDKKLFDVLNDIASSIGNASWWISPDRKFYFRVATDFDSVTPPTHLREFQLTEELGDLRTEEKITGASAGVTGIASNATLRATLAARTGGSGKIERAETVSDIHSDTKAATEATRRLSVFGETQKTITCICEDLTASTVYNLWPLDITINGIAIEGDYVITERTIIGRGPDLMSISVTLKNNNFFARYGYALKEVATIANENTNVVLDNADDEKLTAGEKIAELAKWYNELAAKTAYDAEADAYSVSRVAYDAAFVALSTYLNAGVAWTTGVPAWFNGEAYTEITVIVKATYDAAWQLLYTEKIALTAAINAATQEDADAAIAAAHEASIELAITASQIVRSRAGVLAPATVTASSKYGDNNAAYAGRLEIATSTDGLTFDADEGCPNDPASTTYVQRLWPTTDIWSGNSGNVTSVAGGKLIVTASGGVRVSAYHAISTWNTKKVYMRIATDAALTSVAFYNGTAYVEATTESIISAYERIVSWTISVSAYSYLVFRTNVGPTIGTISFIYVGTGAALWYRSAADESSKVYTPPVTSFGAYVVMLRIRLYKAGGFTINLREKMAGITLDPSAAAIYWGPLTTAPTTGICVNDYYFDSNTVAGGGGIVRYWTGSVWAEMTSAHALWKQAWGNLEVLTDAAEWANAQGSVVAAATAIFDKLFASYVIAAYLFAQQIEVPTGGRIRFFSGQGVQKRCVELADDHIDWLDTPDTSPATAETLRGRIGRQAVGDAVLLSGVFSAPVELPWLPNNAINAASSQAPFYIQTADGQLRVTYVNASNYIVERLWSGTAWGAEVVIDATSCVQPTYIQTSDGQLRIAYISNPGYLVERLWSGTAWGAATTINAASSNTPAYIQTADGQLRIAYRNASNYLVERLWSGTAWGAATTINAAASSYPSYVEMLGQLRIAYRNASGYLVERLWSGTAWGAEVSINAADTEHPTYVIRPGDQLIIVYERTADNYAVSRTLSGTSWGAEVVISTTTGYDVTAIQTRNGEMRVAYSVSGSYQLWERIKPSHAQLGAGIIESDYNANGRYVKFSDGTMICWGDVALLGQAISTSMTATWTFPAAFIFAPNVQFTVRGQNSGSQAMVGLQAYNGVYASSVSISAVTLASYSYRAATGTSSDWVTYNMMAIGRWKL